MESEPGKRHEVHCRREIGDFLDGWMDDDDSEPINA